MHTDAPIATGTPANDNAVRPAEFDRQIAAAYPRLLARAKRFTPNAHELANQTVVAALQRWTSFRETPGDPYYGFYTWLCWVMRGSAADFTSNLKRRIVMVSSDAVERPEEIVVDGAQEASADLAVVLNALTVRERDILLRRATGEHLWVIAAEMGVSKQRVSQIELEARARVRALLADNDNVRVAA